MISIYQFTIPNDHISIKNFTLSGIMELFDMLYILVGIFINISQMDACGFGSFDRRGQ